MRHAGAQLLCPSLVDWMTKYSGSGEWVDTDKTSPPSKVWVAQTLSCLRVMFCKAPSKSKCHIQYWFDFQVSDLNLPFRWFNIFQARCDWFSAALFFVSVSKNVGK